MNHSLSRSSRALASIVVAIVTSLVLIGLVWANSLAEEGTPPDSTDVTETTDPEDETDETPPEGDDLTDAFARIEALEATVSELETQLVDALAALDDATAMVDGIGGQIAKLGADGTYTGTISPRQISPRLDARDIGGSWPLDRTSGELGSDRLNISASGCTSDSRYYSVLTLGGFRGFACVRIPKEP